MTSNGVMAVILRHFAQSGSFECQLPGIYGTVGKVFATKM